MLQNMESYVSSLLGWADRTPDKPAIICEGHILTYGDLGAKIYSISAALRALRVKKGDRIVICVMDKALFTTAVSAAMACGAIAVPLRDSDKVTQDWIVNDTDAQFIIHDGNVTITAKHPPQLEILDVNDLSLNPEKQPVPVLLDASDFATIMYTSGTQAGRKGVLLSHGNLLATARYINEFLQVTPEIVEYVVQPPDHAFGFGRVRCVLIAGGTVVFDNTDFNVAKVIQSLQLYQCNAMSCVSSAMVLLLEKHRPRLSDFSNQLRWFEIGSLPMNKENKAAIANIFPEARIAFNFGMTEAMRSTLLELNHERAHNTSSGRASPGTLVRICDENRIPLPAGQQGIVEVRGPHVAQGYWQNNAIWQERFVDGWFQTDDIGHMDDDGYLYYVGRRDDLINLAGEKVSPIDLEDSFRPYLVNLEFCVSAITDSIRGEVPVLCIKGAAEDNIPWSNIYKQLIGTVPAKFLPKAAFLVKALPKSHFGKIQRGKLRRLISQDSAIRL